MAVKSPIRVGIVGAGNISTKAHIPAWRALDGVARIVAIADPTPERLALGAELAGLAAADAHADPRELVDRTDVEVVDLCTPQHLRRDLAIAAAAAGKHILSEKPLATTPRDAQAIVDAARANGVRLGVVHNFLFFPEVARTLKLIRDGAVGRVEVAILNWLGVLDIPGASAYRPDWRHDPRLSGGGVLMDMLHVVYLAEALLGRPIERVSAWIGARAEGAPVEDLALCRFETDASVALVNVGWGVGAGGYSVSGSDGRIEVTYRGGGSGVFAPFDRLVVSARGGRQVVRSLPPADSIRVVFEDFVAAVRDRRDPAAPGEQGRHILDATLVAYLSAALGRTVELPLAPGHPVFERGVLGLADVDVPSWSSIRRRGIFGMTPAAS